MEAFLDIAYLDGKFTEVKDCIVHQAENRPFLEKSEKFFTNYQSLGYV